MANPARYAALKAFSIRRSPPLRLARFPQVAQRKVYHGGTPRLPDLAPHVRAASDRVGQELATDAIDVAEAMTVAVLEEVPEYAPFAAATPRQLILDHSLDHVYAIATAIRAWSLPRQDELEFVRRRGSMRAMQQLPLGALLHGYRVGHRIVWEHLVRLLQGTDGVLETSLALTALTLEYTELISGSLATAYTETQRDVLLQADRDRRDLLERVLLGTFDQHADGPEKAGSTFALVPRGDYVVVLVTSADAAQPGSSEALSRVADALHRHFGLAIAQPFVVIRQAEVVCVAPLARVRPAALADLTRKSLAEIESRGGRWCAGLSTVCAGLGEVGRGYQEAHLATRLAAARDGVCALLETRISDYLVQRADDTTLRMIPFAARQLAESPHMDDRVLVQTLLVYANAELNVAAASTALSIHPNTVNYRLRKLGQRLGRDLSRFSDLLEVVTWFRILGYAEGDQ